MTTLVSNVVFVKRLFQTIRCKNGTCNLFCFLQSLVRKECDDEGGESEQNVADFVAVLQSLLVNILCGLKVGVLVDAPTDHGEHRVPYACTESGVEEKLAYVHT